MEKSAKVISVFKKKAVVVLEDSDSLLKTTVCYNELGEGVTEGDMVTVSARPHISNWKRWLLYASPALFLLVGFAVGFAFPDEFLKYALLLGMVGLSFLLIFIFKTNVESLGSYEYILFASSSLEERIKLAENEKLKKEAESQAKLKSLEEKTEMPIAGVQALEEAAQAEIIPEKQLEEASLPKEIPLAETGTEKEDLKGE